MASLVLLNPKIQIGSSWTGTAPGGASTPSGTISSATDISAYVMSVDFGALVADVDDTTFGSGGFQSAVAGLKSGSVSISVRDDFASSALDSILWPLLGTTVYCDVMPTSSSRGATNPSYIFAFILTELHPVAGKVGDLAQQSLSWKVTGAYARVTS